jgi:hypothetical protein
MLRRIFGGGADRPAEPERGPAGAPRAAVDATLARLEAGDDTFVIFDAGRGRYVQVSVGDGGLYGEAVSNRYLKGDKRIDETAMQTLAQMGWTQEPDANYSRTWTDWRGDQRASVVDDIVGTLMVVYEMPAAGPLDITTGT